MTFLDLFQLAYGDVFEPLLGILYAVLIFRIIRTNNPILRSQFYIFTIATGVCAISNVFLNFTMRIIDVRTRLLPNRGLFCTIDSWLSHMFALSLTLGKILTVSTRFTAICLPDKEKKIWTHLNTNVLLIGMFLIPFLLFVFFPFQTPVFAPTADGYGRFLGIEGIGYKVAKAIGAFGYALFFVTTIPMCIMVIMRLRKDRMSISPGNRPIPKYEQILVVYAVILTATHMLKSVLQYLIPNILSSFAEPILLVITSSQVRVELFPCCSNRRTERIPSIAMSTVSNHPAPSPTPSRFE